MGPDLDYEVWPMVKHRGWVRPTWSIVYFCRGVARLQKRQLKEAVADFDMALECGYRPESLVYKKRGQAKLELGLFDEAQKDFSRVTSILEEKGKECTATVKKDRQVCFKKAIKDFSTAIEMGINNPEVYFNRGMSYLYLGEFEKAVADFNKAIELGHQIVWLVYTRRAEAKIKLGRSDEAIEDLDKALAVLGMKDDK